MFIKPIQVSKQFNIDHQWLKHSGNQFFLLQEYVSTPSLVDGFSTVYRAVSDIRYMAKSLVPSHRKRSIMDYKYRILLKIDQAIPYVVSVSENWKEIHSDWQWIEQNLSTADYSNKTEVEVFELLYREFEKITNGMKGKYLKIQAVKSYYFPDSPALPTRYFGLDDMSFLVQRLFRVEDQLISFYYATWMKSNVIIRGYIGISKYHLFFYPDEVLEEDSSSLNRALIAFKEISNIKSIQAKTILSPELFEICSSNGKKVRFILFNA